MPTLRANGQHFAPTRPKLRAIYQPGIDINNPSGVALVNTWHSLGLSFGCCVGQHLSCSSSITVATVALGGRRDAVDADGGGLAHDRLRGGCGPVVLVDVRLLATRAAGFIFDD